MIHVPSGTPAAMEPVTPSATMATYLPVRPCGARSAANANTAGVDAAAAPAATIRSVMRATRDVAVAAARFATTKIANATVNRRRRGTRASAMPATGAMSATAREKTVTSCPARASLTPRSSAISGRTPAIT